LRKGLPLLAPHLLARALLARPLLAIALLLPGCGLKPLYAGGGSGAVASALADVEVAPIQGRSGWLVANALRQRLGAPPAGGARYRLDVRLDDQITGLGVRRDDAVTRERRTLRARYQLVDAGTGTTLVDATAGSDAGVDVVQSEYATIAAENSALERLAEIVADQVVARLALRARDGGGAAGASAPTPATPGAAAPTTAAPVPPAASPTPPR